MFAQSIDPAHCFYFDGHSGFHRPNDFLTKLRNTLLNRTFVENDDPDLVDPAEVTKLLNQYAIQKQGVILFMDTFEQFAAIEDWLRVTWLYTLNPLVKVCIAGRYALDHQWMRGGWNLLIKNVELQPLSTVETQAYAQARGINNRDIVESLQRFSGGVPLALSMSCEIIARNGKTSFLDHPQQDEMVGYLAAELMNDIDDASLKKYAESASVVWKFDQELMQAIIQENIPTERFRDFCRLPFVIRQERSWILHDSIRQWIFTDFRSRMPQRFRDYRKRALTTLREMESAHPDRKTDLAFEKIYLHEDDFVRSFCFQWDGSLAMYECKEQHLQQVEQLYLKYLHNQSNYIPGEIHLEKLIKPLWEIDPSAFVGLWKEQQLVAFCSCIPLTEQTIPIFRDNPLTANASNLYDPNQRQYIICIAGVEPQLQNEINGSVARAMVKIVDRNAFMINLISMPYWIAYIPLLGFERAPWADSRTELGVEYKAFQLDMRTEGFAQQVDRIFTTLESLVSIVPEENQPTQLEAKLSLEEAVKLVQSALKQYSRLPLYPEVAYSLRFLLPNLHADQGAEWIGQQLQERIHEILQSFADGSKEERRYYQILRHAYIQKIGTHDTVAEYLNIPNPSYYRYLRSAVRKLTFELIKTKTEISD